MNALASIVAAISDPVSLSFFPNIDFSIQNLFCSVISDFVEDVFAVESQEKLGRRDK